MGVRGGIGSGFRTPFNQAFSTRNAHAPPDFFPLFPQAGQGEGKPDMRNPYTMPDDIRTSESRWITLTLLRENPIPRIQSGS